MSSDQCRAKNPNNCRHHGNSFVAKMKKALETLNFSEYEKTRDSIKDTKMAELPVDERPEITNEDAHNAVRANYGSMEYNSMSQAQRDTLAWDEKGRLSRAAKYMPDRVITSEAIDAYIGEWVEDGTEEQKKLTRVAARHVLTCTMNPKNSNPDIISMRTRSDAIRKAEAEAEAFYGGIEKEEAERVRLSDTRAVCNIMWHNRHNAKERVMEHLNDNPNSFTETEKETLLRVAETIHPDNENHRDATNALAFLTSTNRLYKTMKSGHHFEDFPMTALFKRYEK
jgi:hypothetical protein